MLLSLFKAVKGYIITFSITVKADFEKFSIKLIFRFKIIENTNNITSILIIKLVINFCFYFLFIHINHLTYLLYYNFLIVTIRDLEYYYVHKNYKMNFPLQ